MAYSLVWCFLYLKCHEFPLLGHLNCALSLDIAKMSMAAPLNSPYQRTGKDWEACHLVSLTLLFTSANYFRSAMKSKRRWIYYGVGKSSERQSWRLHTAENTAPPPRSASLKKRRSHHSCSTMSSASLLSTTQNPRELCQHDKKMHPDVLVIR